MERRRFGRDERQGRQDHHDDQTDPQLYEIDRVPHLVGGFLLVVLGQLERRVLDGTRLRPRVETGYRRFGEHAGRVERLGDARALLHHQGDGDGLHLVLHVLVAARLGGHADDLDVFARAAVQRVEHPAENLDGGLMHQRSDDRYFPHVLVQDEPAPFGGEKSRRDDAWHDAADQNDDEIILQERAHLERGVGHRELLHVHLEPHENFGYAREDEPDVIDARPEQRDHRDDRHDQRAFKIFAELGLPFQKLRGAVIDIGHVAALRGQAEHVGREPAEHVLLFNKNLFGVPALLQFVVDLADTGPEGFVFDIVDHQLKYFVVRQFLPDEVRADPDECDDLRRLGLHLDIEDLLPHAHDAEPPLRQGVLHLFPGEGLLLSQDGFFVAALDAVQESDPWKHLDEFKLSLGRHHLRFLLRNPEVFGFNYSLNRLSAGGETLDSEFRHGQAPLFSINPL